MSIYEDYENLKKDYEVVCTHLESREHQIISLCGILGGIAEEQLEPLVEKMRTKLILDFGWCPICSTSFDFHEDGPFASCQCGTIEWTLPRPTRKD